MLQENYSQNLSTSFIALPIPLVTLLSLSLILLPLRFLRQVTHSMLSGQIQYLEAIEAVLVSSFLISEQAPVQCAEFIQSTL